jgi:aryl-alcohol dehydrogenase-like predicted oxidoreductase
MKIALGTVQFGVDYGVSNAAGRTPPAEVARILQLAAASGIDTLDTARAYGTAEQVLGDALAAAPHTFRVITKTQPGAVGTAVADSLGASLAALRLPAVDALLFHRAADLEGDAGARNWAVAEQLRAQGLVQRLGLSAYTGAEVRAAATRFPLDLVQLPANLLDQRLLRDGTLAWLAARGVEVHVRSAFLQGLLLMAPGTQPAWFDRVRPQLDRFHARCRDAQLSPLAACLGFLVARPEIARVVVGVNDAAQLRDIVAAAQPRELPSFDDLAVDDPDIIDPSRWKIAR